MNSIFSLKYFFQNPLCARVLLPEKIKAVFYQKVRNPNLSYLSRKALRKQIQEKAKKVSVCPECGDINGVVKKCGLLKIMHDKYRSKKPESIIMSKLGL